ncbi:MAG: PIN domain-containing protein [Methanocellales archaeon]
MSIIIDTSAIVAARNSDDKNHKTAIGIFEDILDGIYGTAIISDLILSEAVSYAYIVTKNKNIALDIAKFAQAKPLRLIFVTAADLDLALELYQQYFDSELSFTDCTTIALMKRLRIEALFTFDREFQGIVKTVGV